MRPTSQIPIRNFRDLILRGDKNRWAHPDLNTVQGLTLTDQTEEVKRFCCIF